MRVTTLTDGDRATDWGVQDTFAPLAESGPPLVALRALGDAGADLLQRTAELPDSEQGLLRVLIEYRYAVHSFTTAATRI